MNKIAKYLNEHILGEASGNDAVCERFSSDGSILSIKPDIVVHPRTVNDIRKIARFTWQMAERGRVIPLTARGGGTDRTGAAIGSGIIVNMSTHLDKIIFVETKPKEQFIHVQSGVNIGLLSTLLQSGGIALPVVPASAKYATIGGAIANNISGVNSAQNGQIGQWVECLEVILSNGDIIETKRITKYELNKKKGLQTFEGELYRKIDGIIEDNEQLIIDKIAGSPLDNVGYSSIAKVKNHDGSFDLTPLIVGSQGTLGIISEIALRTVPYEEDKAIIVATFVRSETARDVADNIAKIARPSTLEIIDGELFEQAESMGKKYIFGNSDSKIASVLYITISSRDKRAIKKILKQLSEVDTEVFTDDNYSIEELGIIREVGNFISQNLAKDKSMPQIINGASISSERREEFLLAVNELAHKNSINLPAQANWLTGVFDFYPAFNLRQIADKQKSLKLIHDYIEIVVRYGGDIVTQSGEGRLKTMAAYDQLDQDVSDVYKQIRETFDPFGTMNPGVKQQNTIKELAPKLNSNYILPY